LTVKSIKYPTSKIEHPIYEDFAMARRLPVPPELEHLIEKRDRDKDRRARDKREKTDRRKEDLGPLGAIESAANLDDVPTSERRSGDQRRKQKERRKKPRRKGS
jgi:hypothetical protein